MPFYLVENEPVTSGLRRIATEQIGIALSCSADDTIPRHQVVHAIRTRCKKLRGLLRLPQPLMGDTFQIEDQRFRTAARQLAGNRDVAVIAKTIASLDGSKVESQLSRQPVSPGDIEKSREILNQCLAAVDAWPINLHGFYDIAPGFARTYRKCLAAWEGVLREHNDEQFHRLRRWAKYHWYQVRILERLNKPVLRKRRKRLRKLQLKLGDAHDLVLLQGFLGTEPGPNEVLLERADARKNELYAESVKIGRSIFDVPVSELVADLSRFWADQQQSVVIPQ